MNDDDYTWSVMSDLLNRNSVTRNWIRDDFSNMSTQSVYEALTWTWAREEEKKMPYYTSYNNTRGDEVATAVLEAYANGVEFDALIRKNSTVRSYWQQIMTEKANKEKSRERDRARLEKLAIARAEKEAAKQEVMTKLSKEELEAFGLIRKGKR